ncbi:YdcF family protein [Salimicrobium jeotgali]|uniref:YdcF family protein n=1 Tax=Salimicrobium jeotgali TaxID=1230341 RepID=UPI000C84B86E|nr:YdcF family protein [Salimicrobium jeotgali]
MQTKKKVIAGVLLLFFLIFLAVVITFTVLGRDFLVIKEKPKPSEVIYVLDGSPGRVERGLALYKERYAGRLILSGGVQPEDAEAFPGLKTAAVTGTPEAESTWEEARNMETIVKEEQIRTLLVVTEDYHSRRTKILFDKVIGNENVNVSYATADTLFDPESKLTEEQHLTAFREYVKLMFYQIRLIFE